MGFKGIKSSKNSLKLLYKGFNQRTMKRTSLYAAGLIQDRTEKRGLDIHGKQFRRYSLLTISLRNEAGRQTRYVDLNDKGEMLGALTGKAIGKGLNAKGVVYFLGNEENRKALRHQRGSKEENLPKREFFGLTKEEAKKVFGFLIKQGKK